MSFYYCFLNFRFYYTWTYVKKFVKIYDTVYVFKKESFCGFFNLCTFSNSSPVIAISYGFEIRIRFIVKLEAIKINRK